MESSAIVEKYIDKGGDERIIPLADGRIKYNLDVLDYEKLLSRGSCTCNSLNEISFPLLNNIIDSDDSFLELRKDHENKLKDIFNFEGQDAFDVIFAPSGSDLPYIPLIFSKLLYPARDIKVLLTCPEELGSGSQMAFLGKYYAAKGPHGDNFEIGEDINAKYNVSVERFAARNSKGEILDHTAPMSRIIEQDDEHSLVGSLVIGSKSGIEDDISIIPIGKDDTMWVVDLCQFRNSKKLVNELLDKGCMVMITGSKFYMSPPFSGAMLVPKSLSQKINAVDVDKQSVKGFDNIFSYYDFPKELDQLKSKFKKIVNKGLIMRWAAAIGAMEVFDSMDMNMVNHIIEEWNTRVKLKISKSKFLELMPHQDRTNKTIISFKVKEANGNYLDAVELKSFHKFLVTNPVSIGPYDKVFIGQPVKYGIGAFIRLAIGSVNIYNMANTDPDQRYIYDDDLVDHIDTMASKL